MSMKISLDDDVLHGRDIEQLTQQTREAVLLYDYVSTYISIGEFAELMNMPLIDARVWLHNRGISTSRVIRDTDLAQSVDHDRALFLQSIEPSS